MKTNLRKNECGVAHLALIVVAVFVMVAGSGYLVYKKNRGNNSISKVLSSVRCDLTDKDLCKFFGSWKETKYFTLNATDTFDGAADTSIYQSQGTDKFRIKITGSEDYETITIDNTVYTKDQSDGKWWKQTLPQDDAKKYKGNNDYHFNEPKTDNKDGSPRTSYKQIGTEKCGNLTCFKYQVIDPSRPDTTQYIWFDNKDYQLRRIQTTTKNGMSDAAFNYDKFSIRIPSPVKELGSNQVVVPGQSEPMTLPSQQDVQNALDQTQQSAGGGYSE